MAEVVGNWKEHGYDRMSTSVPTDNSDSIHSMDYFPIEEMLGCTTIPERNCKVSFIDGDANTADSYSNQNSPRSASNPYSPKISNDSYETPKKRRHKSPRSVRMVSLDSSTFKQYKTHPHKSNILVESDKKRSLSANETSQVMNPLSFENIDLLATPLSSLRSCSEYNRVSSFNIESKIDVVVPEKKSFWTKISTWGDSFSFTKTRKASVNYDEQSYMVDNLRFNSANLVDGEDYNYSSVAPDGGARNLSNTVPSCLLETSRSSRNSRTKSGEASCRHERGHKKGKYKTQDNSSFLYASSIAIDVLFGYGLTARPGQVMEIELKNLKEPELITYERHSLYSEQDRSQYDDPHIGLRRISSLNTFEMNIVESPYPASPTGQQGTIEFQVRDHETWIPFARLKLQPFLLNVRRVFSSGLDDIFYESLRIQPFASGHYLRIMLMCGFSSTFLDCYNVIMWPEMTENLSNSHANTECLLYSALIFQMVLNLTQLPLRISIHRFCWESSRAIEVDSAINIIRTMLHSDVWFFNILFNRILDVLGILNLIFSECYLWFSPRNDPLRYLVVSLCATNLLTLAVRVIVATSFSLSMHDPQVLSEARRRGLSKWDLDVLPTFVFTNVREVTNTECSICLGTFDMGEMLISLPCDKKHSFHASCIRQWLQRQNSCPLCQRLV